jgi:hypothetical protein
MLTQSQRGVVQKKQHTNGIVARFTACHTHGVTDPTIESTTYQDALWIPHWRDAIELEFQTIVNNETWPLVPPCPNINVIDSKCVFKTKRRSDGSIERHKARIVAKGSSTVWF